MLRAAQMQHTVAYRVRRLVEGRRAAGEPSWSLSVVSQRAQTMNYDGLMRVLRGDVHMTLLHVSDLSRVLTEDLVLVGGKGSRWA